MTQQKKATVAQMSHLIKQKFKPCRFTHTVNKTKHFTHIYTKNDHAEGKHEQLFMETDEIKVIFCLPANRKQYN